MEIGLMKENKVMEFITMLMELSMKVNGLRASNKEKDSKPGPMVHNIRETMLEAKRMGKESLFGVMEPHMMEILKIIILREMENIYGQMERNSRGNGKIIKCTEKVYLIVQMAKCILVLFLIKL
jgi:hypothetical protein